jgi:hypothetical protein
LWTACPILLVVYSMPHSVACVQHAPHVLFSFLSPSEPMQHLMRSTIGINGEVVKCSKLWTNRFLTSVECKDRHLSKCKDRYLSPPRSRVGIPVRPVHLMTERATLFDNVGFLWVLCGFLLHYTTNHPILSTEPIISKITLGSRINIFKSKLQRHCFVFVYIYKISLKTIVLFRKSGNGSIQLFKVWGCFFLETIQKMHFPKTVELNWKSDGTIRKCSLTAFQWMVITHISLFR